MASEAQIKANRRNAMKSTGPKSMEGKSKVSKNAITYGVFTDTPLLPHENAEEFKALCENMAQVFPPTDAYAAGLVERIVMCIWRQRRLRAAEAAKLNVSLVPESYVDEINKTLRIGFDKHLTAEDISAGQESNYQYFLNLETELNTLDIKAVPTMLKDFKNNAPNSCAQLHEAAQNKGIDWSDFLSDSDLIIKTLEDIKKNVGKWLAGNKLKHTGYELAEQIKVSRLIPMGDNMDFLTKYQTQLDTDLYRAIDAYKRHVDWREKYVEIEVNNKTIE